MRRQCHPNPHKQTLSNFNTMKKTILILLATAFTSCVSTSTQMNRINVGMNKSEVILNMGQPISSAAPGGGTELLRYRLLTGFNSWSFGNWEDYYVKLENGKVIQYGKLGDFDSTKDPTRNINLNIKTNP